MGNTNRNMQIKMIIMSADVLPGGQVVGVVTTDDAIIDAKQVIFGSSIPEIDLLSCEAG